MGFRAPQPFVAYVALLNGLVNHPALLRLSSMPRVLVLYMTALAAGYPLDASRTGLAGLAVAVCLTGLFAIRRLRSIR